MKTVDKGTVAELQVQLMLVEKGYQVFTPINEGCRVDLVFIDDNGTPKKVQVKKSKPTGCGFSVELRYNINKKRTEKGRYSEKDIDLFGTTFDNKLYLIPVSHVKEMAAVVLRYNEKYKNQNKPFFAKNYEIK